MSKQLINILVDYQVCLEEETARREINFLEELLRWNKQVNLTSIRNYDEALEKHLVDSLVLLKYLPEQGHLLDMGSGGGLPGIPLAIARRELQVTSVDSVGKKISFQRHIKRLLALDNLMPVHARLEEMDLHQDGFDFVVARALSSLSVLAKLSAPLLRNAGELLLMKGPEGTTELKKFATSSENDLFTVKDCYRYQLPVSRSERQLLVLIRNSNSLKA